MNFWGEMLDSVVRGLTYGAKIGDVEWHQQSERIQLKFIKRVLELDRSTSKYIVLEETKRGELE